jgi:hypothetical protein
MGRNVAGGAHTSHHEANLRVLRYRPVTLGLWWPLSSGFLDGMQGVRGPIRLLGYRQGTRSARRDLRYQPLRSERFEM